MQKKNLGKIFIVEDNELNLKLFSDLLVANHYSIEYTKDGNLAADMIRDFMPNLILVDIQLQSMSGIDIIKQIKEDKIIGLIPIIAVTAFAMKDDKERIMASGCDGYIAKPISIEPFLETIANFIKR